MTIRSLLALFAFALLLVACDDAVNDPSCHQGELPFLQKDATLYDCDGQPINLLDWAQEHDVSYVGFAAGWCIACKEEVPRLNDELVTPNGDEVGVSQILMENDPGVAPTEGLCAGWREDLDADYDIFIDKDGVLLDAFFAGGPIKQLPVHLIVDGYGGIRWEFGGNLPTDIADRVTLWLPE